MVLRSVLGDGDGGGVIGVSEQLHYVLVEAGQLRGQISGQVAQLAEPDLYVGPEREPQLAAQGPVRFAQIVAHAGEQPGRVPLSDGMPGQPGPEFVQEPAGGAQVQAGLSRRPVQAARVGQGGLQHRDLVTHRMQLPAAAVIIGAAEPARFAADRRGQTVRRVDPGQPGLRV